LGNNLDAVFERTDDLFGCFTNPIESIANDRRIVRFPRRKVERRATGIEPAVPPNDVRDRLGLDFPFRLFCIVADVGVNIFPLP
jgi:hypothetical protein